MSYTQTEWIEVVVSRRRRVVRHVVEFRLERVTGGPLPECAPASHIEVITPATLRRSYSLTSAADGPSQYYEIAVAMSPRSAGGSSSMHREAWEGSLLKISAPQGGYAIDPKAEELVLIAGGVGITPMVGLQRHITQHGGPPLRLVYLVGSRAQAAYLEQFSGVDVVIHAKEEHAGRRFDLWQVLERPGNRRLFCCGSQGLLREVRALTMHWRSAHLHFEDFHGQSPLDRHSLPFTAVWEPTGEIIEVRAQQTLLEALEKAGVRVGSSCRSGTCGSCRLKVRAGSIRHRDVVLTEDERAEMMLCCVSRGEGTIKVAPWMQRADGEIGPFMSTL